MTRVLPADCELIETMRVLPDGDIPLWHEHRHRLERSAEALGFVLEHQALEDILHSIVTDVNDVTGVSDASQRCRLTLRKTGDLSYVLTPLGVTHEPVLIRLSEGPVVRAARTRFLDDFKVSMRDHYEYAMTGRGHADDVLLMNEASEITECTIYNIYAANAAGIFTPPLRCGLLPGIERARLLRTGWATEQVLQVSDVMNASQLYVSNAVRGCLRATLV